LESKQDQYSPPIEPGHYSYYYNQFKSGACLYPRPFWFIESNITITLGFDQKKPPVRTSSKIREVARDKWSDVILEGEIESEYIFLTLLGKDIIPFGFVKFRPIILPCQTKQTGFDLIDITALRTNGKRLMADWLTKAQNKWQKGRSEKSAIQFPKVSDRLDHYRTLSDQDPVVCDAAILLC
jgi:hypothetical protein